MVFATLDLDDKCVQIECAKHGWAEVRPTKEGETRVFKDMKNAEEYAKSKQKGIWRSEQKLTRFVDYSNEKGATKAK